MKRFAALAVGTALLLTGSGPLFAQRKKKDEPAPATPPPAAPAKKADPMKDKLKTTRAYPGLLQMHQDTVTGALYMVLKKNQVGKEYIYWSYIENGLPRLGLFRGNFWDNGIFSIEKYFDRIDFVRQNTDYYFDPNNALSRAKDANINRAILASSKIVAKDSASGDLLIEANGVFLSEALTQIKPSPNPAAPPSFGLGQFQSGKSRVVAVRNYPANTDVVLDYVYENPTPFLNNVGIEVTDPRVQTVRIQHTLIEMPQNDFVPRFDDPRVGYFGAQITDLTSHKAAPYRDFISRWNLKKKDPSQAISEPVEPIVFWIENTTPKELRPLIKEAGERWNIAFEKAGFRNAVLVKEQPDDATWDAGDIRYNVLRWTSSPTPPFGGYGPSFINPRTGQIIGADIMLEWGNILGDIREGDVYDPMAAPSTLGQHPSGRHNHQHCAAQHVLSVGNSTAFALAAGLSDDAELLAPPKAGINYGDLDKLVPKDRVPVVRDGLFFLILHEMGHTLGLNHNMKSSNLRSFADLHNIEVTEKEGLTGSVMEYPGVNFANSLAQQGNYYPTTPGPYDIWAIQFGYDPSLEDAAKLKAHLGRSLEPQLAFGNDADDMRSPFGGIDPRVNIYDLSSDALAYAKHIWDLSRSTLPKLPTRLTESGDWYQRLRNGHAMLRNIYGLHGYVVACYIGGVEVTRAAKDQPGSNGRSYKPVAAERQKQAMKLLNDYIFAPNAFAEDANVFSTAALQRRGFNQFGGEDLRLHSQALAMHRRVLGHLLHPNTTRRITDTRLYGNTYSLSEMMNDLTGAIFSADLAGNVNTIRQNLQTEYVNGLIAASGLGKNPSPAAAQYDHITRREVFTQLKRIDGLLATAPGTGDTQKHRAYLRFLIDTALDD